MEPVRVLNGGGDVRTGSVDRVGALRANAYGFDCLRLQRGLERCREIRRSAFVPCTGPLAMIRLAPLADKDWCRQCHREPSAAEHLSRGRRGARLMRVASTASVFYALAHPQ